MPGRPGLRHRARALLLGTAEAEPAEPGGGLGELERLSLPFEDGTPSEAELRVAQAQLVGWLEGLFHGIQTALFAQQMAARQQLEQMRKGLPAGMGGGHGPDGGQGQYL